MNRHVTIDIGTARPQAAGWIMQSAAFVLLYAFGLIAGFVGLVLLFRVGLFGNVDVLFFRGLLLIALGGVACFVTLALAARRWPRTGLTLRDAFSAAILSVSFNISFLVLVPVTMDRSISVFILGEMASHPQQVYGPQEMSDVFSKVYVDDYQQVARRLREQSLIGNVEEVGPKYRISARGRAVIAASRLIVWMFGGDTRFVSPKAERYNRS